MKPMIDTTLLALKLAGYPKLRAKKADTGKLTPSSRWGRQFLSSVLIEGGYTYQKVANLFGDVDRGHIQAYLRAHRLLLIKSDTYESDFNRFLLIFGELNEAIREIKARHEAVPEMRPTRKAVRPVLEAPRGMAPGGVQKPDRANPENNPQN